MFKVKGSEEKVKWYLKPRMTAQRRAALLQCLAIATFSSFNDFLIYIKPPPNNKLLLLFFTLGSIDHEG